MADAQAAQLDPWLEVMSPIIEVLIATFVAGAGIPLGGMLAAGERLPRGDTRNLILHGTMAFGGGALLAAVALVLVPEGAKSLAMVWVVGCFVGGGVAFLLFDKAVETSGLAASQLIAMLMDFAPEAIALGAAYSKDSKTAYVLAALIALQNTPEGFNTFRELRASGFEKRRILRWMAGLTLIGPACGATGFYLLAGHAAMVAAIMLFAAGGITYLIFQDIAPASRFGEHWSPALGAVLGFALGLAGDLLVG